MTEKIQDLCRFACVRTHRRGEYALCTREPEQEGKDLPECLCNQWFSTGHASQDSYIDLCHLSDCPYKRLPENK